MNRHLRSIDDRVFNGFFRLFRSRLEGPNTIGNSTVFWQGFIVVLILVLAYPLVRSTFRVSNAAFLMTFIFLALSLGIIWGYTDIFSFGQVAFFGVGGYVFGIVGINLTGPEGTIIAFVIAVLVASLFALALGYFMFYGGVSNVYVAIVTLVVTMVLWTFMRQTAGSEWAIGDARLGGANGMTGVPSLSVGVGDMAIPLVDEVFYYVIVFSIVLTYLGLRVLVNSDYGYAMVAIRENNARAEMLGYNTKFIKLQVFTLGGALAGVGGVFFASWSNFISPDVFGLTFAVLPIIWVATGGRKSILGAIIGAYGIEFLTQQLAGTGTQLALVIIGAILIIVILYLPEGAIPQLHKRYPTIEARVRNLRGSRASDQS